MALVCPSSKRSQVWVETAIYILIGLTIIAILLASAMPQIEKIKDRGVIKQSMDALNIIDDKIVEVEQSPGSIRNINLKLSKGRLEINPQNDTLLFTLENSRLKLSEPGIEIQEGIILVKTEEHGSRFNIFLKVDYSEKVNITYRGEDKTLVLQPGTTPHKIQIENVGDHGPNDRTHIDFDLL